MRNAVPVTVPKNFRHAAWVRVLAAVAALAFSVATAGLYLSGESRLIVGAMAGLSLIAALGFIDALLARVELREDSLVVFHNLRRTVYLRNELSEVTWGKGVATAVRRASGEWVVLPEVGASGQGLANSIRAWLKERDHPRHPGQCGAPPPP